MENKRSFTIGGGGKKKLSVPAAGVSSGEEAMSGSGSRASTPDVEVSVASPPQPPTKMKKVMEVEVMSLSQRRKWSADMIELFRSIGHIHDSVSGTVAKKRLSDLLVAATEMIGARAEHDEVDMAERQHAMDRVAHLERSLAIQNEKWVALQSERDSLKGVVEKMEVARRGRVCASVQTDPSVLGVGLEDRVSKLESLFSSFQKGVPSLSEGRRQGGEVRGPPGPSGGAPSGGGGVPWTEVVGRGKKRKVSSGPGVAVGVSTGGLGARKGKGGGPSRVVPAAEAVVIACRDHNYEETMKVIRKEVKPEELGVEILRHRRTVTGALLFEVRNGPEGRKKADELAQKVREATEGKGVTVSRPHMMGTVRVGGIVDSVLMEEVVAAVAEKGGCASEEVSPTGRITRAGSGLGLLWLRLPLAAAKKVAQGGVLQMGDGWARASVALVGPRPLQCYRCLGTGHAATNCRSVADRSDRCYRCGGTGHRAKGCGGTVKCPLCGDLGLLSNHRFGSGACRPPPGGGGLEGPIARCAELRGELRPAPPGPDASVRESTDPGGSVDSSGRPGSTPGQDAEMGD